MTGRGKGEAPEAAGGPTRHSPVLLAEIIQALAPQDGERYIDCTFGAGGYSRAILESADCRLLALDRDPLAAEFAAELAKTHSKRFRFESAAFSSLADIAADADFVPADAVIFDLGVSSMQLDEAERGFSFMRDGPLDMRMSGEGPTAADIVNRSDEADLAEILFLLGEERRSRPIARAIVRRRERRRSPARWNWPTSSRGCSAAAMTMPGTRRRAASRRCGCSSMTSLANWSPAWRPPRRSCVPADG